jgi:hypothetical protein
VISALLACSRWWFEELGGFDETFEAYGGEDWALAHHSWTRGGLVAHVADAVAWHDGPDAGLAPREHATAGPATYTDPATLETAAVAQRVGAPGAAYRGLLLGARDLVVTCDDDLDQRALTVTLDALLAAVPRAVVRLAPTQAAWFAGDPRITSYDDFRWCSDPARLHLHLLAGAFGDPAAWTHVVTALDGQADLATLHLAGRGVLLAELHDLRLHRRADRWPQEGGRPDLLLESRLDTDLHPVGDTSLQAWLGGWG